MPQFSFNLAEKQVFQDLCQLQECFWRRHEMGHMLGSVGHYNQEEDGDVPSMFP